MKVEQFVMAYGAEQDRLRAMLPEKFESLRPVLRINAEIRDNSSAYVEFNTAAEADGRRGWINIRYWEDAQFERSGRTVTFKAGDLKISYTGVGLEGSCPAEKDNDGCYFQGKGWRPAELITANKEFCDCEFQWEISGGAGGKSIGATLPAIPQEQVNHYPKQELTVENAAVIPCEQVLGSYKVIFEM